MILISFFLRNLFKSDYPYTFCPFINAETIVKTLPNQPANLFTTAKHPLTLLLQE